MKNYQDSDYALNKFSDGIVYSSADGTKVTLTLNDFLTDHPEMTAEDFRKLKELSDGIYHSQVRAENAQTYKNSPFDEMDESILSVAPSPEELHIGRIDASEEAERRRQRLMTAHSALDRLTAVQRRRYLLHHSNGLTTREIAVIERVDQRSVMDSLEWAEKKIKKFLRRVKK